MRKLLTMVGFCGVVAASACAMDDGAELSADEASLSSQDMKEEDEPAASAGCAHIQWCDEPGYWGTICKVDVPSCGWVEIGRECAIDAEYVCGRAIPPIDIRL